MSDGFYESLLTQTCVIKSRTLSSTTKDKWGVPIEDIATSSASAACLIQQNAENIEVTVRGKKEMVTDVGFFKSSANIVGDDIVELDDIAYQVLSVNNAMSQGHHIEAMLKKIENS